jgi:hypothetical protein
LAKFAVEVQALDNLKSRDGATFDCLISLAWPFGNVVKFSAKESFSLHEALYEARPKTEACQAA